MMPVGYCAKCVLLREAGGGRAAAVSACGAWSVRGACAKCRRGGVLHSGVWGGGDRHCRILPDLEEEPWWSIASLAMGDKTWSV